MMRARILYIALSLFPGLLHAQIGDSLVRFNELTFYSEFERETFQRFQKKEADVFALFMANGSLLREDKIKESEKKFYDQVELLGKETTGKKNDKRVKLIYDNLHAKFLSKYELKNRFEEVFYNGNFNCVSATALYALAFEKLGIPYGIKEEPSHVYLIAYPYAERIVLQTTSPSGGYYTVSDEFKQRYVKTLNEQKLISHQEYTSRDVNTLFDTYYFGKGGDVTLVQLASLQYMNDALYKCDEKKFEDAFKQFEKAYLISPSDRMGYMLLYSGGQAFEAHKAKDSTHAVLLSKLARYTAYGIEPEMIVAEFAKVTQDLLFESRKKAEYDRYYTILTAAIRNQKLNDDITFVYYYENGRFLYNQAKFKEALPYLEKTLTVKPNDLDAQGLFLATLGRTLSHGSNTEIIKQLEDYSAKFPALQDNNNFNAMKAATYLIQFNRSYGLGKIAEGDSNKALFEKLADKYPDIVVDEQLIGQSYSAAAIYYFRKGQVKKAKEILATGLKYAPNNYELIARQQMIK